MLKLLLKIALLLVLIVNLFTSVCAAQSFNEVSFSYDANGNRTSQSIQFGKNEKNEPSVDPKYAATLTEVMGETEVVLYPNPTPGRFTVAVKGENTRDVYVTLSTTGGAPLEKKRLVDGAAEFDLSGRSSGLYLVEMTLDGESKAWSVLKR